MKPLIQKQRIVSKGSAHLADSPKVTKIAFVTELFYPNIGGQEVRFLELAKVCSEQGWKVEVLTIGKPGLMQFEWIGQIKVLRLVASASYQRPIKWLRRNPFSIVKFSMRVRSYLKANAFDVVVFNQWPVLPQLICPNNVALTVHDWCEHRSGLFWRAINGLLANSTHKHVCVSAGLERTLKAKYKLKNSEAIPSGIHTESYSATTSKQGVLFLGRLAKHKHPEDAIEAMIIAREKGLNDHLTIAGDGPLFKDLSARYGHLPFLRILGGVSDELKYQLFAEHRIYILPSEREGFPRGIAEAMACGTPVITTEYPDNGAVDVVRSFNCGVVVEPTIPTIAEGLLRLSDALEWQAYSSQGLQASVGLDWQVLFRQFERFLGVVKDNHE